MKVYNILIHSDFFHEWEIIKTNIPIDKLEHYLFIYANWHDLSIDFWEVVKNSGYYFVALTSSESSLLSDDLKNDYFISENNIFFINDYFYN